MLRIIQWAMLASVVLYSLVGEVVHPASRTLDSAVSYLFTTMGVAIVGVIFVVRRTMVFRAEESLASRPDDTLSLNHWKTGYIVTYVLCEALAMFGLVQRILGASTQQSLPYYIGGFVLLFFFRPHQPQAPAST
jgi:cytochrome b561